MTDQELLKALEKVQDRFDSVNRLYIRKVAEQIKQIGELNQSSINRLVIMAEVTSNVSEITNALMTALNMSRVDISAIFNQAMADVYTDPRFTQAFSSGLTVPPMQRAQLVQYTRTVAAQTLQTIDNVSNTTAIAAPYRAAVDQAILATSTGVESYTAATRNAVRSLGYNGLQVQYESGYHRRLDTAVRQNVIDATHQIAQHGANIVGEALGYDAVELSAHMHSAPDHEPMQGRIFLKAEFDKMQSGGSCVDINGTMYAAIKRKIGEWNCQHFALPYSTQFSKPRWSEEQLRDWAQKNKAGCEVDGKHVTTYQAQQLMRKIETEVRRWKDTAVAAQYAQDNALRRQCQGHINALAAKYSQIAAASGLTMHKNRMTVEGFRPVKLK